MQANANTVIQRNNTLSVANGTSTVHAGNKVTFTVKNSAIDITPAGININAPKVNINPGSTGALPAPTTQPGSHSWICDTLAVLGLVTGIGVLILAAETGVAEVAQEEMAEEASGIIEGESSSTETASDDTIVQRQQTARDFYKKSGLNDDQIKQHMSGIDFNNDVSIEALPKGRVLAQKQTPDASQGNYYSEINEPASKLGINPEGQSPITGEVVNKEETQYITNTPVDTLRSRAASTIDHWSVRGTPFKAEGGGIQYFSTEKTIFMETSNE